MVPFVKIVQKLWYIECSILFTYLENLKTDGKSASDIKLKAEIFLQFFSKHFWFRHIVIEFGFKVRVVTSLGHHRLADSFFDFDQNCNFLTN
jgi:hypothetical protein